MSATTAAAGYDSLPHERLRELAGERYRSLFEPLAIGPKVAPNRFWTVPYTTGFTMDRVATEARHRGVRAEGGWGVVSTGECIFDLSSRNVVLDGLELLDDHDARELAQVADAIHAHGSLAAIELVHLGALAQPGSARVPALAVSQMQTDALFFSSEIGKTMELDDIARIRDGWATAARRARDAGFDVVYVHCAHSYLPMQFLAPYYNQRTDHYGGTLENRARFLLETLAAVRAAVGAETAVACRFAIESLGPAGLPIEEALQVMRMADPLVDLWDVCIGGLANADNDLTPSRLYEQGHSFPWTRRAKEATAKPVVGSGRLTDPDLMVQLIRSGDWDFIGGARPGIADPYLPRKIAEGRFGRIRECIGSNQCAKSQVAGALACSQNATTGEEHRRGWHPERFTPAANRDRPVLVIGAGPAGMECAVTLARRGFEHVHLVDADRRMGGHLRWFSRLPGFNAWSRLIEHRQLLADELPNLLHVPGRRMSAEDVLDYGGQLVVVAAGSRWATVGVDFLTNTAIPGADAALSHVFTPEQVMAEQKPLPDGPLVVYDCEGDVTGVALAQELQRRGRQAIVASPFAEIAKAAVQDNVAFAIRAEILAAGGSLLPGHVLAGVRPDAASFVDEGGDVVDVPCAGVVLVTRRVSDERLHRELVGDPARLAEAGIEAVFRIGDCVAPRHHQEAIFDGHRLAREIDTADPAIALTPRR